MPITTDQLTQAFSDTFGDVQTLLNALRMLTYQVDILTAQAEAELAEQQAQQAQSAAQQAVQQAQAREQAAREAFNAFVASLTQPPA